MKKIDVTKIRGLNTEMIMLLSACIDKMDIGEQLKSLDIDTGDNEKDTEELGKQLIVLIISKIYKAKDEIYEFIASYKNIDIEEAKKLEIIPVIQEILGIDGIKDFLS